MNDAERPDAGTPSEEGTFEDLPLHPKIRQGIRELGYHSPTPIQRRTIPDAVGGRDLIGTAQTGTGKTAAFLLPILERLLEQPTGRILALVLTPTRELAIQAEDFLKKLGRHTRLRGAAVYGGVGMGDQERALRGGAEIIVATPGRLLDHMSRGYVRFQDVRIVVLDEADRMLDMGFLPDVRRILSELPRRRQTMLFSATMPPEIVRLAKDFTVDPKTIQVGPHHRRGGRGQPPRPARPGAPQDRPPRGTAEGRNDDERARLRAHQAPRRPRREPTGALEGARVRDPRGP